MRLYHSELDRYWTEKVKGKEAISLRDDGNGVDVYFNESKTIRLNYSQVVELRAILNVLDDADKAKGTVTSSFKKMYFDDGIKDFDEKSK